MFVFKRALACLCLLLVVTPVRAFTFSYGNLFDVKDVRTENGAPRLPLTRGKYRNIKLLSKQLYVFLGGCRADCRYEAQGSRFAADDYRRAFTNDRMMIADVTFNDEIILTFLVFKNKDGFSVKTPEEAVFKDKELERSVRQNLTELAEKIL